MSDRARESVEPAFVGWISVETPWDFADRAQPFKPNALAMGSGTGGLSFILWAEQSLTLLTETGLEKIEAYLGVLTDELCKGVAAKNYDIVSSRESGESSAIVCIKHGGDQSLTRSQSVLKKKESLSALAIDRLHIAPHFYNNLQDIERLLGELPA